MNKYLKFILLLLFISNSLFAQESQNTLVLSNGNRTKKLHIENDFDNFKVITYNKLSKDVDSITTVTGYFHEVKNGTLRVFPKIYNVKIASCDSSYAIEKTICKPQRFVDVDINSIKLISYQDASSQNRYGVGTFFYVLGGVTSLVVAPLISINYSKGTFNEKRYFRTLGIGAGLVCIGVPLAIFGNPKKFYFMPKNKKHTKNLWRIVR